jgi:hypothetical protein
VKWNTGLPWQKQHSTRRRNFHQQIGLKFKKESSEMLHLECRCVRCWDLDTSESRSEIPGKFWNVVLEKDGEGQSDQLCEKWISVTQSKGREEYHTYNKLKEDCLDWSNLAQELSCKTQYWRKYKRKDRSDGTTRKKT